MVFFADLGKYDVLIIIINSRGGGSSNSLYSHNITLTPKYQLTLKYYTDDLIRFWLRNMSPKCKKSS